MPKAWHRTPPPSQPPCSQPPVSIGERGLHCREPEQRSPPPPPLPPLQPRCTRPPPRRCLWGGRTPCSAPPWCPWPTSCTAATPRSCGRSRSRPARAASPPLSRRVDPPGAQRRPELALVYPALVFCIAPAQCVPLPAVPCQPGLTAHSTLTRRCSLYSPFFMPAGQLPLPPADRQRSVALLPSRGQEQHGGGAAGWGWWLAARSPCFCLLDATAARPHAWQMQRSRFGSGSAGHVRTLFANAECRPPGERLPLAGEPPQWLLSIP